MQRPTLLSVLVSAVLASPAPAQHEHPAGSPGQSPYAGFQSREIKALSPEDVERYRNSEGMGLALAGELNRYPGPKHVLELADQLHLSSRQTAQITRISNTMRSAARRIGDGIINEERTLDRAFATRRIDEAELRRRTAEIARLQGDLRFTHLKAHLDVAALLTADQISRYDELRGYAAAAAEPPGRRRP